MVRMAERSGSLQSCQGLVYFGTLLFLGIVTLGTPTIARTTDPEIGNAVGSPMGDILSQPNLVAQTDGTLQRGDRGDAVVALQQALGRYGLFAASNVDGVYGQSTEQAIRTFQRIRAMPVTGIADAQTLDALDIDLSSYGPALIHPDLGSLSRVQFAYGDSGADVTRLQRSLRNMGLGVDLDGVYGSETQQAVRTFQRVRGLPVTGTADRSTLNALGFQDAGGDSRSGSTPSGNSYVAVIIGSNDELPYVRRLYTEATLESTRHGQVLTIGRFADRGAAENRVRDASQRGYDARVMHAHEL